MKHEIVTMNIPDLPINLGIRNSNTSINNINTVVEFHFHDEIEILYISVGKMKCSFENNNEIILSAGEVILINRRIPHKTTILEKISKSLLFQFNLDKIRINDYRNINRYLSLLISAKDKPYYHFKKNSPLTFEMIQYLENIEREYSERKKSYNTYILANMYAIIGCLYRNSILDDVELKFNSDIVRKILPSLEYIDKNYKQTITLMELSEVVNMNESYFCRLFKKATNNTITEYINFVRIWKAELLLTTTDLSILEISMEVGFSSVSYFNRVFKKLKNKTPSDYRKVKYDSYKKTDL